MCDLSTTYLGLQLRNPVVASPSPLCEDIANLERMEESGIGAIVLHSLFEEQIQRESKALDHFLAHGAESYSEALSYFPDLTDYNLGPEHYLDYVHQAKLAVKVPVIASLNGVSSGGWVDYAKKIEEAGADGLELNVYYVATDPDMTGQQVEEMYVNLVQHVTKAVSIPVAVKIAPFFSSLAHTATRLSDAGAKALVLFDRFYQPDLDIESLEVVPNLSLSTPNTLRLRLRWTAILYGHVDSDIAITGGVHSAEDVIKSMMAGAKVAMMTSALLKYGIGHVRAVLNDLSRWLDEHEYDSIELMQGSMSQRAVAEPAAFERANYLRVLSSYTQETAGQ